MKKKSNQPHTKKLCKNLQHDFKNLKRFGRADWRCPKCGDNVMLLLLYMYEAGIDPNSLKNK